MRLPASAPRVLLVLVILLELGALVGGCRNNEDIANLTPRDRANRVKELRKRAEYELKNFQQSSPPDFEALQRHAELHRETTVIMTPMDCPICFANYGAALTRLGLYYEDLVEAFRKSLETAPEDEKPEIEAKIERYSQEARRSYELSNTQFETFFRNSNAVLPVYYEWVFRQSAALGDFSRALHYLDLYAANVTLSEEGKRNVEILKQRYRDGRRRQEEKELEREFQSLDGEGPPGSASRPQLDRR